MTNTSHLDTILSYAEAKNLRLHPQNRQVENGRVATLKKCMASQGSETFPQVIINRVTNNLLDGQHRVMTFIQCIEEDLIPESSILHACYVDVDPSDELKRIIKYNQNTKNWRQCDYVESYAKSNEDYQMLIDWASHHELCIPEKGRLKIKYACKFLIGHDNDFKKGDFCLESRDKNGNVIVSKNDNLRIAEQCHNSLIEILDTLGMPHNSPHILYMIEPWRKFMDKHPLKKWKEMLSKKRKEIYRELTTQKPSVKHWIGTFFEIDALLSAVE